MIRELMSSKGISIGFIMPLLLLFISLVWIGIVVVWKNLEAKDIVFSFSALVAAFVMFLLNVLFSLQSSTVDQRICPHLIHTKKNIDIYSVRSGKKSAFVVFNRDKLSEHLNIPDANDVFSLNEIDAKDFDKKLIEYIRLSIIGTIIRDYPDWSPKIKSFRGSSSTNFNFKREGAGRSTFYSINEIIERLNLNATEELLKFGFYKGITLPPDTTIYGKNESILIENSFVKLEIHIEVNNSITRMPFSYDLSGNRMYISSDTDTNSYDANINYSTLYKKQRSFSPDLKAQKVWVEKLFSTLEDGLAPV